MIFPNSELKEYSKLLSKTPTIHVCIIGQDIYPKNHSGIAFNKNTFDELLKNNCSGKYVLNSFGLQDKLIANYPSTKELFFHLLERGVAFINISYELLKEIDKKDLELRLNEFKIYNNQFLIKSENICLLGFKTKKMFEKYYPEYKCFDTLLHPSPINKIKRKNEWEKYYKSDYLKQKYNYS